MAINTIDLENRIISELEEEISSQGQINKPSLIAKVKNAVREVVSRRQYQNTSYTDERILLDIENYYSVIRNVALYDYAQDGAPFQNSHSENSVNRSWTDRNSLLSGVAPFVKVL